MSTPDLEEILLNSGMLVTVMLLGVVSRRLRWVPEQTFEVLSALIVRVTLPALMLSVASDLHLGAATFVMIALGAILTLTQMGAAWLVTARRSREEQGFAMLNGSGTNVGLFAMPYLAGILGPGALVPALAFDLGNGMTACGPVYAAGVARARPDLRVGARQVVAVLGRSPVFLTGLAILVMRGLGWHLPGPVQQLTELIGGANLVLAMFMLGVGLRFALPRHKYLTAVRLLGVRLVVAVVFVVVTWFALPLDEFSRTVLCALYFSPVATVMAAFTHEARGDVELSAFTISASILLGLVAVPLVLVVVA